MVFPAIRLYEALLKESDGRRSRQACCAASLGRLVQTTQRTEGMTLISIAMHTHTRIRLVAANQARVP